MNAKEQAALNDALIYRYPYKPSRAKNKPAPKKHNHKHDYQEVMFKYRTKTRRENYCLGKRCIICGKEVYDFLTTETIYSADGLIKAYRVIPDEELLIKYADRPIIETSGPIIAV